MCRCCIILIVFLAFFGSYTLAQNPDNLNRIIQSNSPDSIRVKALFDLGSYYYEVNADSSIKYFEFCIQLSRRIDNVLVRYNALNSISSLYIDQSNYNLAKESYTESLAIAQQLNDSLKLAISHSNLGGLYSQIELNDKAIYHFKESSRFINTAKKPNEAGKLFGRLGNFYLYGEYYNEAEENYLKAIQYFKSAKNLRGIIIATQNLGVIASRRKNYDKAISYYNQALSSYESINYTIGVGQCLANIGNIYTEQGEYEKAIRNHEDALKLFKKNNQVIDEMLSYTEIADVYNKRKEYGRALQTINKAKVFIDSIPENNNSKIAILYQLHTTNKNVGNIDLAYKYLLQYQSLSDTLNKYASAHKLETLKVQYEVEQKDRDLKLLTVENELKDTKLRRNRLFQIFYLVTIAFSVFAIVVLFTLFRIKRKANQILTDKNSEILQQKEEIEAQREEIEAQRDDLEIQRSIAVQQRDEITFQKKNITDSIAYAKHIQTAMLPNENEILQVIPDSFVFFKPLDIVSGDFYWVNNIDSKSVLAVADCTGHGVPRGLYECYGD